MNEQELINEQEMRRVLVMTVGMTTDELTDKELAVLNIVAQLNDNPRNRLFDYEIVKGLFTENGGTRMHEEAKIALAMIVNQRLGNG